MGGIAPFRAILRGNVAKKTKLRG